MRNHPEQLENEIYLGNCTLAEDAEESDKFKTLKTRRYGLITYDIYGKKFKTSNYRPVFIDRSEEKAYDKIMNDSFDAMVHPTT